MVANKAEGKWYKNWRNYQCSALGAIYYCGSGNTNFLGRYFPGSVELLRSDGVYSKIQNWFGRDWSAGVL